MYIERDRWLGWIVQSINNTFHSMHFILPFYWSTAHDVTSKLLATNNGLLIRNRDFKITTTATATGTSLNKRFNEQNIGCARAL